MSDGDVREADRPIAYGKIARDVVTCRTCRHRRDPTLSDPVTNVVTAARDGRFRAAPSSLIADSHNAPVMGTLYSGLACRWLYRGSEPRLLGLVFPGDFFDVREHRSVRRESISALTEVTFCRFSGRAREVMLSSPPVVERMLAAEARWRHLAEERAVAAAGPASAALCHLLLSLHEGLTVRGLADPSAFTLPISRSMLAHALGLSPVHLRRLFGQLSAQGVLALGPRRWVRILDAEKARDLAGAPVCSARPAPLI